MESARRRSRVSSSAVSSGVNRIFERRQPKSIGRGPKSSCGFSGAAAGGGAARSGIRASSFGASIDEAASWAVTAPPGEERSTRHSPSRSKSGSSPCLSPATSRRSRRRRSSRSSVSERLPENTSADDGRTSLARSKAAAAFTTPKFSRALTWTFPVSWASENRDGSSSVRNCSFR